MADITSETFKTFASCSSVVSRYQKMLRKNRRDFEANQKYFDIDILGG